MTPTGLRRRRWSGRGLLAAAGIAVAGLISTAFGAAQITSHEKPPLAEEVFKNVQVLKGIPVEDFLETMGLMAAALQFDCSDCHVGAGTAGLSSFVGKGTSVGFGGFGGGGGVEIVAKAPDKRATIIVFKEDTGRGDQIRTYDGRSGWLRTPLNVLSVHVPCRSGVPSGVCGGTQGFPAGVARVEGDWVCPAAGAWTSSGHDDRLTACRYWNVS